MNIFLFIYLNLGQNNNGCAYNFDNTTYFDAPTPTNLTLLQPPATIMFWFMPSYNTINTWTGYVPDAELFNTGDYLVLLFTSYYPLILHPITPQFLNIIT